MRSSPGEVRRAATAEQKAQPHGGGFGGVGCDPLVSGLCFFFVLAVFFQKRYGGSMSS
jgi:hypothetical protein